MTDEQLREAVARALCTADEQNGGPPWDYVLTMGEPFVKYYYDRADAAIALMRPVIRAQALEEAAKVADEYGAFDHKLIADAEDDEERAAFERGAFKGRNIAAAIRALKEKPNE